MTLRLRKPPKPTLLLTKEQERELKETEWLFLRGSLGGTYRITAEGRVAGHCIGPVVRFAQRDGRRAGCGCPVCDPEKYLAYERASLLSLKLLIETDEQLFLSVSGRGERST